jgi:phosphoglucosamine mutase
VKEEAIVGSNIYPIRSPDARIIERIDLIWPPESKPSRFLAAADKLVTLPAPMVVDTNRLEPLLRNRELPTTVEDILEILHRSRIKLQGTDGIRGTVRATTIDEREALSLFLREAVITPALFRLITRSYCSLLDTLSSPPVRRVFIVEDGRDATDTGLFLEAVIAGANQAGFGTDCGGVVPTPAAPFMAEMLEYPMAISLTASHNPPSQNGIKIFWGGEKLYPEGLGGEYHLTAHIFSLADVPYEPPAAPAENRARTEETREKFGSYILENLPHPYVGGQTDRLPPLLLYDGANGACSPVITGVLSRLGIEGECFYCDIGRDMINVGCGVGEYEGSHSLTFAQAANSGNRFLAALVDTAQRFGEDRFIAGMANDGDGDRVMLLLPDRSRGEIVVLDGDDICALLIEQSADAERLPEIRMTVESDLGLQLFVDARHGLHSVVTAVGDRWLVKDATPELPILGCEASGHIIFPTPITTVHGNRRIIHVGNGVLAGLKALPRLYAHPHRPFPRQGAFSLNLFFVDRSRLSRGSEVWHPIKAGVEQAIRAVFPGDCRARSRAIETEPDLILYEISQPNQGIIGRFFLRKSGTEEKVSLYARYMEHAAEHFNRLGQTVMRQIKPLLIDDEAPETQAARRALRLLAARSESLPLDELTNVLSAEGALSAQQAAHVIYGLRKMNMLGVSQGKCAIKDTRGGL